MGNTVGYDATSEVRFAVVLYGGISLAIYMNGIVQELLELVRATAPDDKGGLHVPDEDLEGAGSVYRKLGRLLENGHAADQPAEKIRTRFVVDIITGTSAGGINGVFLGKALANDQRITPLSDLWVQQGAIEKLLNDGGVSEGNPAVKPQHPPLSLLSGERMLYQLLRAIDGVSETNPAEAAGASPYAEAIDLWVTTTDLFGRPETIDTGDQRRLGIMRESNYRKTFHFLYDSRPESTINLFERKWDPMLAFAARCTSSFPLAFQPVQLTDLDEAVDGVGKEFVRGDRDWADTSANIGQFFREYGGSDATIKSRSFADGGYLDNNPVDLVMSTLPKRRAELPVARRVLIVDPDPGADVADPDDALPRADLLATLIKVGTLPRIQTVGGEVNRILDLREPLDARRRIYDAVDQALATSGPDVGNDEPPSATHIEFHRVRDVRAGRETVHEELDEDFSIRGDEHAGVGEPTVAAVAYRAVRVSGTASDIGEALARIAFPDRQYDAGSQQHRFATRLVEAWLATTSALDNDAHESQFLDRWDLSFWLRRINFVQARARELEPADAQRVRRGLDQVYTALALAGRDLRQRDTADPLVASLRDELGKVDPSADADLTTADYAPVRESLTAVLGTFADTIQLSTAEARMMAVLGDDARLRRWYTRFGDYDQATLAVRDLIPGENDDIEVIRVSPRDTKMLVDEQRSGSKLAGARIHHFGGFFEEDWRRRDILWGRLDAAERLISALWPQAADGSASASQRDGLILDAHRGILKQVLADSKYRERFELPPLQTSEVADPDIDHALTVLRENQPPAPPDSRKSLVLAARAARVTDAMGTGLVRDAGPFVKPTKWVGRALRLGANLVELALPDRMRSIVARHLLDVAILAAFLMILLGGFFGGPGVVSFGWTILLVVIGLKLVIELLRLWFVRGPWLALIVVLVVALAALGVYAVASWHGWAKSAGLLAIGAVVGLVLAMSVGTFRRGSRSGGKPVVAGALALLIVVVLGSFGAAHARSEIQQWSCDQHGWYRAPVTRMLGASCGPTETTATPSPS